MHEVENRIQDTVARAVSYSGMVDSCREMARWSTDSGDRQYWTMLEQCHMRTVESCGQIMDVLLAEREASCQSAA